MLEHPLARELSRYDLSVTVIERKNGIGLEGTSTNHHLVCQRGDSLTFRPGTLHAELNIKSIPLWPKLADELKFRFRRIGGLWLIRDNQDYNKFQKMHLRAFKSSLDPKSPYLIPKGSFEHLKFISKNEKWIERVVAVIVLKDNYEKSEELRKEIMEFARNNLAHFKAPKEIIFVDSLPKSPSGKILKREIRNMLKSGKEFKGYM
ncbi:MAG: FAD-dependent oxidoreductase [Caldisphaera sp.]